MKEIKFRQAKKRYVEGDMWHYWGYIEGRNGVFVSPLSKAVAEEESYQFTNKVDNKGVDIYEGDKLKYSIDGYEQSDFYTIQDMLDWFNEMNNEDSYYRWDSIGEVVGNVCEDKKGIK